MGNRSTYSTYTPYLTLNLNLIKIQSSLQNRVNRLSTYCKSWTRNLSAIIGNQNHAFNDEFSLMPSRRCYLAPQRKTNRYVNSFIPPAIRLLNSTVTDVVKLSYYLLISIIYNCHSQVYVCVCVCCFCVILLVFYWGCEQHRPSGINKVVWIWILIWIWKVTPFHEKTIDRLISVMRLEAGIISCKMTGISPFNLGLFCFLVDRQMWKKATCNN